MSDLYKVRIAMEALNDLWLSFEWGVENWGLERAKNWFNQMDELIRARLTMMPYSNPLAPETFELDSEVRQLLAGRYRVLYTIEEGSVLVIRVRGPYSAVSDENDL